jgi:GNAT superfamily N-acetyltransferase
MLDIEPRRWHRDNFLVSTEPLLIQVDQVNAALSSDLMWWAQGLPKDVLTKTLHNSLCLGLYVRPQEKTDSGGMLPPPDLPCRSTHSLFLEHVEMKQIGLDRVITDDVTFAYLTDVYILPEYQGKGLGKWLLECLNEVIKGWRHLRRFIFLTSDTMDFYRRTLGAKEWSEFEHGALKISMVEGPGRCNHTEQEGYNWCPIARRSYFGSSLAVCPSLDSSQLESTLIWRSGGWLDWIQGNMAGWQAVGSVRVERR